MIKNIRLKFGRTPGGDLLQIPATPITVFVGPNNSGKSKILQELLSLCRTGQYDHGNVILKMVEFEPLPPDKVEERISRIKLSPNPGEVVDSTSVIVGNKGARHHVPKHNLVWALTDPIKNAQALCQLYLSYNTLKLDGDGRIGLINEQNAGDLQATPTSTFQVLFKNDSKREEARRIIKDAFNLHLVVDPTKLGRLRLRLASRAPATSAEERGVDDAAVKYHGSAMPIEQTSDGVKAFTGMITEIIAGDPHILLIDEPEAFLHPSLAFTLGRELSRVSAGSEKRLFVSTHSSNFVMGCIQSGTPVNIVRLTYQNGVATARILPNNEILKLMRNPLLRSTGILEGIFYESVVVAEGDTDRAFYGEINERLLQFKPEWGIKNCLFVNAQNKHTLKTIIRPLRELGIPTAGIVDIDILKDSGKNWTDLLSSGFIPELEHQPLGTTRHRIGEKFEPAGKEMKKGGVDLLSGADREAANNLFDRLGQYGLFVVRRGELERWLGSLKSPGHGPEWLIDIFEKMGEDPESPLYLRPSGDDVWEFIGSIKAWIANEKRHGIPS